MTDSTIRYEKDADGIVTLVLDDPAQSANTMNEGFIVSLGEVVDRLTTERDTIAGVVVTSAKKTFFAGGDLNDILRSRAGQAEAVMANVDRIKEPLRRLETLGRPVVAAIGGAALGGGLEIALATHHRIALNAAGVQIGLPEVTLGLLPGGGGVVRTVRLLGVVPALTQVLLQGQRHTAEKAHGLGLIDELVDDIDHLVPAAKKWIADNPDALQPWDVKGYRIPGGTPASPALAANLPAFPANLRKQLKGAPYPAPIAIMTLPSKARSSTSTRLRRSRTATSPGWPRGRSRRT